MSNIKDILTTIAGIFAAVGSGVIAFVVALPQTIHIPDWVTVVAGILGAIGMAIIGFYNGKNPDGSSKTFSQVTDQLNKK